MDFSLPFPSLKNLALICIGSECLNQRLLSNYQNCLGQNTHQVFEQWSTLKASMIHVVDNLGLPKGLLCEMWDIIMQLYYQVIDWRDYCYTEKISRDLHIISPRNVFYKFCFNNRGEIHKRKMLKTHMENIFMNYDIDDMTLRFKFACVWCLEDFVLDTWNGMKAKDRKRAIMLGRNDPLLTYWIDMVTESSQLPEVYTANHTVVYNQTCSIFKNLIMYAMQIHDKIASEYFWHKLTDVEKVKTARYCAVFGAQNNMSNLLWSSLQFMNAADQLDVWNNNSYHVLLCFLDYPYDQFFFPTLELVWDKISERSFLGLCEKIVFKMGYGFVVGYQDILQKLWHKCSREMKKAIKDDVLLWDAFLYQMDRLSQDDPCSYYALVGILK